MENNKTIKTVSKIIMGGRKEYYDTIKDNCLYLFDLACPRFHISHDHDDCGCIVLYKKVRSIKGRINMDEFHIKISNCDNPCNKKIINNVMIVLQLYYEGKINRLIKGPIKGPKYYKSDNIIIYVNHGIKFNKYVYGSIKHFCNIIRIFEGFDSI